VLPAAREALARCAWDEAYDTLARADREEGLSPEGLELFAEAAWYASHPDEVLDAYERASGAYLDRGDRPAAAMMAFRVAEHHGMRLEYPSAGGWIARAEELAADDPDAPIHGYLAYGHGMMAVSTVLDYEGAAAAFDAAMQIAERTGDRNLYATSMHNKGRALCWSGRLSEGLALMDRAMATAVAGDLHPASAGYLYCSMIDICSSLGEYGRSAEWTDATQRLCERLQIPGFTGICRVHRPSCCGCTGTGRTPRSRRAWPAASCRSRTSSSGWDSRGTRSARCAGGWATWTVPRRRTPGRTSSAGSPSPGCPCSGRRRGSRPPPRRRCSVC
jgi:hypothetical protein